MTHDAPSMPVKKGKPANSESQPSNSPLEGSEREESDTERPLSKSAAKKKPPASTKERVTQPMGKVFTATAPSQEEIPKALAEHANAVIPTKPKKKVNLGRGQGLLGGFGGIGGIGASSINWGGEMGGYGIPLALSSPAKGGGDNPVNALQGSMFTFGANR